MSMPQYIEIAVVGSTEKTVKEITKGSALTKPGISPKYHLLSLTPPNENITQLFSTLNHEHVLYWLALDNESMMVCNEASEINKRVQNYDRGFYDQLLPTSVKLVDSKQKFIAEVQKIYEAFCATS